MIVADKNEKKFWISFLKGNFPDRKIVFERQDGEDYDIFILRSTKINFDNLMLNENKPKAMIFDSPKTIGDYNVASHLAGLSKEFWHSIFLYNLSETAKFPNPIKALQELNNRSYINFVTFVKDILIPYSNFTILDQRPGPNDKLINYLNKIGYNTNNIDNMLSPYGIDNTLLKGKYETTNREL